MNTSSVCKARYTRMTFFFLFGLILTAVSLPIAHACDEGEIPYSINILEEEEFDLTQDTLLFRIMIPQDHDVWKIHSITFSLDEISIPIALSQPNEEKLVSAHFYSTLSTLKRAKIVANYRMPPLKDGSLSLCAKWQDIKFDK